MCVIQWPAAAGVPGLPVPFGTVLAVYSGGAVSARSTFNGMVPAGGEAIAPGTKERAAVGTVAAMPLRRELSRHASGGAGPQGSKGRALASQWHPAPPTRHVQQLAFYPDLLWPQATLAPFFLIDISNPSLELSLFCRTTGAAKGPLAGPFQIV
jgi:hypothetical protein